MSARHNNVTILDTVRANHIAYIWHVLWALERMVKVSLNRRVPKVEQHAFPTA